MQKTANQQKKTKYGIWIRIGLILLGVFVLASLLLFVTERWLFHTWASLDMDEIIFHLNSSIQGTNPEMIRTYLLNYASFALLAFLFFLFTLQFSRRRQFLRTSIVFIWIAISLALLEFAFYDADRQVGLREHFAGDVLADREETGDFIYDNYADPETVELRFPEKKRNLIYIYLESMETTYADQKSGGAFTKNVIPELTELGLKYECFSGNKKTLNGGIPLPGTTWTIGAIFGQSAAMPLKLPASFHQDIKGVKENFYPSLTALGDILEQEGYRQVFMLGSDSDFGARDTFFGTHGNFDILDYNTAKKTGVIPEDYFVFWGFEDEILFREAQKQLMELSKGKEPFNLTLLTVDTHFEDGYVCGLCKDEFGDNQYANVMACSSRQVAEFVHWIQKQEFYDNTTIVLCGDHLTMDTDFCSDVPDDYQRRTFTVVINSAVDPVDPDRTRQYSTMDMYPTTLAALGVAIRGNRLGLGTNLFSLTDSMIERFGVEASIEGMNRHSDFMDSVYYGAASEDSLETAINAAKLTYRVEDNGRVTFTLKNTEALERSYIQSAELEITDRSGKVNTIDLSIKQSKTDPSVYWGYAETNYKEKELTELTVKAYFEVKGFSRRCIASLDQ